MADDKSTGQRNGERRIERRVRLGRDSLPGQRNDLPEAALGRLPADPQGDENRTPPPNAPTIPE